MKQTTNYFAVLSLEDEEEEDKEVAPPPPPTPETPPSSGSPLADKVPVELRLKTFELVLQSQYSVVNVGHLPLWKRSHRFNTALFAVSRTVSDEAREIFYKVNIVRVKSLNDPYRDRLLTRHLELAGDVAQRIFLWRGSDCTNIGTRALINMPKLKTVSIATDFAYDGSLPRLSSARLSQMSATAGSLAKPADDALGVPDFGVSLMPTPPTMTTKLFLKRFRFIDAVAYARKADPEARLEDLTERYEAVEEKGDSREVVRRLFVLRVACLEARRAERGKTKILDEAEEEIVAKYFTLPAVMLLEIDELFAQIPAGTRVVDLTAEEHGGNALRLADDILGDLLPLPRER